MRDQNVASLIQKLTELWKQDVLRWIQQSTHHHPALNQTESNGRITGQLSDTLATAFFFGQFAQTRNYRSQQLHHDASTDVWHNAEREQSALGNTTTRENIQQLGERSTATFPLHRLLLAVLYPLVNNHRVDTRQSDVSPDLDYHQH